MTDRTLHSEEQQQANNKQTTRARNNFCTAVILYFSAYFQAFQCDDLSQLNRRKHFPFSTVRFALGALDTIASSAGLAVGNSRNTRSL